MEDSLIGFLNKQEQKTTQAQEQQPTLTSTSTSSNVTNPSYLNTSITRTQTGRNEASIFESSESSNHVNPEPPQNNNSQRVPTQGRISSLGGLGITNALTDAVNTVVSGATCLSSGNVLPIRGTSSYSTSIRNRSESMLLQHQQPASSVFSSQTSTQSNKLINMSSSGIQWFLSMKLC